ncbi:MAG: murein hydrolase activator EnvC family protein [Bacillota bacterium]
MSWLRGYKGFLALLIIGGFFVAGLIPTYADQLEEFQQQQRKVQNQMEQQKRNLEKKEQEKKTYLGQLEELEVDMAAVQGELKGLEKELRLAEDRVKVTEKELEQKEKDLDERMGVFKERMREVYINGQVSYLEVVFAATDFSDFLTRFDLLEKLLEQDVNLLNEIEEERQEVAEKKQELEQRRDQIASLKASTQRKQQRLAQRSEEKRQLLKTIDQEKSAAEKALNEMEALSEQLAEQIRKIQLERRKNSGDQFNGVFSWPTPGYTRITSEYGMRTHPILKTKRMHTGIDIGAPAGVNIKAAADGTVIYTGLLGAFGNVVVIDHGDGISSMYCHMSKILASNNQKVQQGDVIGKVGSTGWSTGPHLHFEVRKDGNPVNPWNYLK